MIPRCGPTAAASPARSCASCTEATRLRIAVGGTRWRPETTACIGTACGCRTRWTACRTAAGADHGERRTLRLRVRAAGRGHPTGITRTSAARSKVGRRPVRRADRRRTRAAGGGSRGGVWVLSDWASSIARDASDEEFTAAPWTASHAGRVGNTVTVNGVGARQRSRVRAGERIWLRLVNASPGADLRPGCLRGPRRRPSSRSTATRWRRIPAARVGARPRRCAPTWSCSAAPRGPASEHRVVDGFYRQRAYELPKLDLLAGSASAARAEFAPPPRRCHWQPRCGAGRGRRRHEQAPVSSSAAARWAGCRSQSAAQGGKCSGP